MTLLAPVERTYYRDGLGSHGDVVAWEWSDVRDRCGAAIVTTHVQNEDDFDSPCDGLLEPTLMTISDAVILTTDHAVAAGEKD